MPRPDVFGRGRAGSGRLSEVVFAAGRGTRLRPLTERLPKALVPVLDVPLVDLALARGAAVGWAARFVNVSHHGRLLRDHLAGRPGVVVLDEGEEPLGTAGTLRRLLSDLERTVVTYNCDLVSDLDVAALLDAHAAGVQPATLAVRRVDARADLVIDGGGPRLVDRRSESRAGYLFLGAACFDRDVLRAIESRVPLGLTEGLLRGLVDAGAVNLFEHEGYACDSGTYQRLVRASVDMLARPDVVRAPGAISADVPAYAGPGALVEDASLGPGAIVLAGAEVGAGASLRDCIVWPGEHVPAGAALANGIYFDGSFIPAGA
ncbi:MAG TPA: NDP-sugar synthase [Actinomycetota bacterium]|nr:NDP-sugar synthase [Actinomycetota bacterium]